MSPWIRVQSRYIRERGKRTDYVNEKIMLMLAGFRDTMTSEHYHTTQKHVRYQNAIHKAN